MVEFSNNLILIDISERPIGFFRHQDTFENLALGNQFKKKKTTLIPSHQVRR